MGLPKEEYVGARRSLVALCLCLLLLLLLLSELELLLLLMLLLAPESVPPLRPQCHHFCPQRQLWRPCGCPANPNPKSAKRRGTPSRGKRKARRRSKIHWHRALLVLLPHIKAIPLRGDVHMHVHAGRPQHPASCRRGNNSLRALVMCIERRRCGAHPLGQHEGACPR